MRSGGGDGRGAEKAGGRGPYVEAAPGVEDVVNEGESRFFRGGVVGVADDLSVRVLGVDGRDELFVRV